MDILMAIPAKHYHIRFVSKIAVIHELVINCMYIAVISVTDEAMENNIKWFYVVRFQIPATISASGASIVTLSDFSL